MPAVQTSARDPFWVATHTIHQLFQDLDEGRIHQVAALFAPTGVWTRQGEQLIGPEGVLHALQARPAALATRHVVSNLLLGGTEDEIRARYYVTVFAHEVATDGIPPLTGPHSVLVCEDRLVPSADAWLFSRRTPRLVFKKA